MAALCQVAVTGGVLLSMCLVLLLIPEDCQELVLFTTMAETQKVKSLNSSMCLHPGCWHIACHSKSYSHAQGKRADRYTLLRKTGGKGRKWIFLSNNLIHHRPPYFGFKYSYFFQVIHQPTSSSPQISPIDHIRLKVHDRMIYIRPRCTYSWFSEPWSKQTRYLLFPSKI